ncbi:uncharacterized protein LOC117284589 isoform X3 [Fukomys damarensis]|uniref:uncharacterized protein LOC117284589 isoform X3 n=1 Tax=Fukomys damarensis TaxID=885580 RepID=UPI0014557AB9|nr:uncharacterized protein LOC117284589 isoform X3 [Fukomys damarensis]
MSGDAGFKSSIPGSPGGPEGGDIWRMQGEQRQPARVVVAGQGCCFALSLLPTQRVYSPTGMGFVILSSVFPSTSSKFFSLHRTLTRPSCVFVGLPQQVAVSACDILVPCLFPEFYSCEFARVEFRLWEVAVQCSALWPAIGRSPNFSEPSCSPM